MAHTFLGISSIDAKLEYCATQSGTYTEVLGLQSIPQLGAAAASLETTCLDNHARTYIDGLQETPDSFDFTVLHDATNFATLAALDGEYFWRVTLSDGATASWKGTCNVFINAFGINEVVTDTLSVKVGTDITFA